MTKILLALLTLAMMSGAALAEQRTFYDAGGRVSGRSTADSSAQSRTTTAVAGLSAARHDRQHDDGL
jgi:hypothetical protein